MREKLFVFTLLLTALCNAVAQDSTRELARILAGKGLIDQADLARVERAEPREGVRVLAALLQEKGLLTASEAARVGGGLDGHVSPAISVQAAVIPAVLPPAQAPKPAPPPPAPAVTSQNKFPLTVYGTLLWNSFYNTSPANIEDVPLFNAARGSDPLENFGMTARQTRVGMRYQGPQIGGARLGGQVEFDLFGGKAALANGMNMDLFRLRLAFGRLDWQNFSLEAGQDWAVFAPLNPTSLASFAIPSMSGSGNLWIRTPQLRAELRGDVTDKTRFQWQVAALDPNVGDYPIAFATVRTPGIGEHGRAPAAETRLGLITKMDGRELAVGLSSHYGRGRNVGTIAGQRVERSVDSWGVALDYNLPLHSRFALSGEILTGRALGLFTGGIGQTVLPVGTPGEHGLETHGGWMQAQINFNPKWQTNLVYGIDIPDVAELTAGARAKNQTYMTNLQYKFSPHVTFAWEWRRFLTNFRNQRLLDNIGDHVNMAVGYTF
jgi:hypothetical protein